MNGRRSRSLLYVTLDPSGTPRVVAALEQAGPAGAWFVPDPGRIASPDPRGRRTTLGALLGAHGASNRDDLVDVAAHLAPLPELDPDRDPPQPPSAPVLDLRWVGVEGPLLGDDWPAPGGGSFQVESAPLRLVAGRQGALLASRSAPGGPWLRPLDPIQAEVRALLELFGEIGVPVVRERAWVARWLDRIESELLDDRREEVREGFRELVRSALLEGAPAPLELGALRLTVRADPAPEHIRWQFELTGSGLDTATELASARFSPDAVGDLLAVLDAPQQPYWLLLFEPRAELGQVFAGAVDLRRYLGEHLEALEGPLEDAG